MELLNKQLAKEFLQKALDAESYEEMFSHLLNLLAFLERTIYSRTPQTTRVTALDPENSMLALLPLICSSSEQELELIDLSSYQKSGKEAFLKIP